MANGWSAYAKAQMPLIAMGALGKPGFYLALFQGTANPDGGSTPAEVVVPGYVRQYVRFMNSNGSLKNVTVVTVPPAQADYAYTGTGIVDAAHNVWFWDDDHGQSDVPAHTGVVYAIGAIVLTPAT